MYVSDDGELDFDTALDRLLKFPRSPLFTAMQTDMAREAELVLLLSLFQIRFKNAAFREEQEWRLSFRRIGKPMRHQQFRSSNSMLIPYVEAELNEGMKSEVLAESGFIREVLIGPSSNAELTGSAVVQLLLANGLSEAQVYLSKLPYRDW